MAKEKAVTIPAEEMADQLMEPGTRDAAVALLKKVRPAVAAIQNRAERPRGGCAALHHPGSRCDERDCSGRPGQRTEGRRHGQAHQL